MTTTIARSGCPHRVDSVRNDFERVDVETRIALIENRQPWLQQHHLQNFVALLFAARKSFVHRSLEHRVVHARVELRDALPTEMKSTASNSGSPRCRRTALTADRKK